MRHNFLFKYDDPEIAEWFDNQPQGTKSKALEQALSIIIANYGTGNLQKAIAKKEVLYSGVGETNNNNNHNAVINEPTGSATKSIDQVGDTTTVRLTSDSPKSTDDVVRSTDGTEAHDENDDHDNGLDMLSDI